MHGVQGHIYIRLILGRRAENYHAVRFKYRKGKHKPRNELMGSIRRELIYPRTKAAAYPKRHFAAEISRDSMTAQAGYELRKLIVGKSLIAAERGINTVCSSNRKRIRQSRIGAAAVDGYAVLNNHVGEADAVITDAQLRSHDF